MTKIEWCEESWNPIVGCSLVSPGCTNCYAMKQAARIEAMFVGTHMKAGGGTPFAPSHYAGLTQDSKAGPVWTGKVAMVDNHALTKPLRWKRPREIFVNSMGDLFHEAVPDAWIDRVFAVMALAPQHTFICLTKRAKRMREYMASGRATAVGREAFAMVLDDHARNPKSNLGDGIKLTGDIFHLAAWPLPKVVLGVSAEDQPRADERIPELLATPGPRPPSLRKVRGEVREHVERTMSANGTVAWFPEILVDETMPPDRASPDAWIVALDDGAPALDLQPMGDGEKRLLRDGEIVNFQTRTDFGTAVLTLTREDHSVSEPMPVAAEMCCALNGWQIDTLSTDVSELAYNLRDAGEEEGEFTISYYAFSDSLPFRFDASVRRFFPAPPK